MAEALALLREEQELEAEDARVVCDPSISVADLEKALEEFFTLLGWLQEPAAHLGGHQRSKGRWSRRSNPH